MGNTKSQKLKESFYKGRYKVRESRKDQLLGMYNLLQFEGYESDICIQTVLDPGEYGDYLNINEFIKKLSSNSSQICDFHFVECSQGNGGVFDLVFDYGGFLKLPFKEEKFLWQLVEQIVDGMLFIEESAMHYPFLHKNYILQDNEKTFKLVNPYCFPDYLKEVLEIYMNPEHSITKRKAYSQAQLQRNIREFGVMLITLVKTHSIQRLIKEPNYWQEVLVSLRPKLSKDLENLIAFILQSNSNTPNSFAEIKNWLNSFKPRFDSRLSIFSGFYETPKKAIGPAKINVNKRDMDDLAKGPVPIKEGQQSKQNPIANQNDVVHEGPLSRFYIEEYNKGSNHRASLESTSQTGYTPRPSTSGINSYLPARDAPKPKTTDIKDAGARNSLEDKERLEKLGFINNTPLKKGSISSCNEGNTMPKRFSTNDNMTRNSYTVRNNPISLQDLPSLQNTPGGRQVPNMSLPELPHNKLNFTSAELPQTRHRTNSGRNLDPLKISPFESQPEIFKHHKKPDTLTSITEAREQPNPDRKIKRVLIRWLKDENRYQKTVEYTDETSEVIDIDQAEHNKYRAFARRTPENQETRRNPNEKPSHMGNYNIQDNAKVISNADFAVDITKQAIITLQKNPEEPALLLFKGVLIANTGNYQALSTVVDYRNPLKPSLYHPLGDDVNKDVSLSKLSTSDITRSYVSTHQVVTYNNTPQLTVTGHPALFERRNNNTQPKAKS